MFPNPLHNLTVVLVLGLLGLVGGIGTGLHDLFGCCHNCQHEEHLASDLLNLKPGMVECDSDCSNSNRLPLPKATSPIVTGSVAADQISGSHNLLLGADCVICQLLANFHTTKVSLPSQVSLISQSETIVIPRPVSAVDSTCRLEPSRGPPSIS